MVWGSGQGKQETCACKHGVNAPASTFIMWQWGCRGTRGLGHPMWYIRDRRAEPLIDAVMTPRPDVDPLAMLLGSSGRSKQPPFAPSIETFVNSAPLVC